MPTHSRISSSGGTPYDFITLRGPFEPVGQALEEFTRPGVNGHAFRKIGLRGEKFEVIGILDAVDFPAMQTLDIAFRDMRGTLVTVIDDFGNTYNQVILHHAVRVKQTPALAHVGGVSAAPAGNAVALAFYRFILQHTKVT